MKIQLILCILLTLISLLQIFLNIYTLKPLWLSLLYCVPLPLFILFAVLLGLDLSRNDPIVAEGEVASIDSRSFELRLPSGRLQKFPLHQKYMEGIAPGDRVLVEMFRRTRAVVDVREASDAAS